ncbi:unnamed protein product [Mytilus edulis]|uniref:TRPM3 n=1 Tax=Mytilus edulis TaxID=6550 RepID=A0A8S3VGI0_MYTED|nr:unnamed protein product [Mytilus edulis]
MNRRNLAMLFWKRDGDYICSALFASSLAKRLAENASAEAFMNEQTALWESSRQYEDLAYSVMTELYLNDRKHARQLLVTEVKRYNSTTIFEITEKFTLMNFMGHAACQTKLNKIWKGQMKGDTSNLKAIAFAVTLLPILKWDIMKLDKTAKRAKVTQSESLGTKGQENNTTCSQFVPNWMRKIYYFYNAPLIKFLFSVLTYLAMLVAFSMFVLTDLHPTEEKFPSIYEYIVYAWAASSLTEEIRQAIAMKHFQSFEWRQLTLNAMTWFSFWTLFELMMYCMFIMSVILRFTLSAVDFHNARMMYAVTLGTFIINSMQFFLVSKQIGPKVIMIGRMMFDVIFFILIFAVFLFGFGVIYQATMYPNTEPGFPLFQNLVYMPYWQLYGELFLEQFYGALPDDCTENVELYSNGTMDRCPLRNQINTFVLAVYMVVTHIILVNLLIAMFSHTFTKVQDNNELVWKFHRFSLIQEYYDRSSLVPPFLILSHLKIFLLYIKNRCTGKRKNKFKITETDAENEKLAILEKDAVYSHLNSSTRLRRRRARNMDAEKDGFEASYEKDTDLSLQEQINVLSSDVDLILKTVKQIMETKQNVLIVEVPRDYILQCIPVQKDTYETWEEEKPVAFLSIVGGTNQYLPNETIKNQLKNGLQEIMETTRIWIKTDGENTSVGKIVEEFAKEEKNLTHATHLGQSDYVLEACITDHLKVPIIMIIIGGDENSFVTAMTYLKMNYPVLVLEGSGRAADFICKGYRLSTFRTSEDKCVLSDTFISEMAEAAKYIYGFNQEERISEKVNCDKLANKLKRALGDKMEICMYHL